MPEWSPAYPDLWVSLSLQWAEAPPLTASAPFSGSPSTTTVLTPQYLLCQPRFPRRSPNTGLLTSPATLIPEPLLPLGSVRGAAFWPWGALGGLWSGVGAGPGWALLAQSKSGMALSSSACVSSSSRLMSLALYWVRAARFSSQSLSAALGLGG